MKLSHLFFVFYFWVVATSFSQLKTIVGETTYPFWIAVTDAEKSEQQPILLFLHGKSLSGTDLNLVKKYGVLRAIEKGRKIPAIVIAPQLAKGFWNPDNVLELIEYVQKNYNVDSNRIYVCGMSLGGYGTMHFAGKYPEKLSAAVAICGGGNEKDACKLATVPFWIIHGDKDFVVPYKFGKQLKESFSDRVKLITIEGGEHNNLVEFEMYHQTLNDLF